MILKHIFFGAALAASSASIAMRLPNELHLMPDVTLTEGAKKLTAILLGDACIDEYGDSTKHSLEEVCRLHSIFAENFEKVVLDPDTLVALSNNFDFCLAWLNLRGGLPRDRVLMQLIGVAFGSNDRSFLERLKDHGFQPGRMPQSILNFAERLAQKSLDEEHK